MRKREGVGKLQVEDVGTLIEASQVGKKREERKRNKNVEEAKKKTGTELTE